MRTSRRGRPPRGGRPAKRGDSSVGSLRRLPRKVGRFGEKCKKFWLTAPPHGFVGVGRSPPGFVGEGERVLGGLGVEEDYRVAGFEASEAAVHYRIVKK